MSGETQPHRGGSVVAGVRPGRHLGWFHRDNRVKDLLRLADLTSEDFWRLRRLTIEFGSDPERHHPALRHETVLCWFTTPSSRRADIVAAAAGRLGGTTLVVDPNELRPARVGSLENAGRVLSSLGRVIIVGGLADRDLVRLVAAASVPIVNGFSDGHDPCEAVAELATLEEHCGSLRGRRLAYLGQACPATHDLMAAAALAGVTLTVVTPDGYQPSPVVTVQMKDLANRHGGHLTLTQEPARAVELVDGIVLGPLPPGWSELGPELLDGASPDAVVLNCSLTNDVAEWPVERARMLEAELQQSRPSAYQAVLYGLTERLLRGAGSGAIDVSTAIREAPLTFFTPLSVSHDE